MILLQDYSNRKTYRSVLKGALISRLLVRSHSSFLTGKKAKLINFKSVYEVLQKRRRR